LKKQTKKDEQHVIPRTYLKHFKIASNQSFVYCVDFLDKYRTGAQTKGLNDKIFKRRKYYNTPKFENQYIIEDVLGEAIEPLYDKIMTAINKELPLNQETVGNLMHWLCMSKMRSPYVRDNIERVANWSLTMLEKFYKNEISEDKQQIIDEYSKITAREIHLDNITDRERYKETLQLYIDTLNCKHWQILRAHDSFPFWTNDNPGFSPNLHPQLVKDKPYHPVMELNGESMIFYVLSPKYCLFITPFKKGTSLDVCALNMKIEYENASFETIDYINRGVFTTSINLVISNQKELLEACFKLSTKT